MGERQSVIFKIDNVEYGIDILQVNEIVKMQSITKIPNTPKYVEGITNLRGNVIPIINLRTKFNLPSKENDAETRVIVVKIRNKPLGIVVDEVAEVISIDEEKIDKASAISNQINDEFVSGVAKLEDRLIILLDLEKVFKETD
ncbi:MAG: chemotaxis protein CheW [Clostridia bacterium]|nr:chemotaxis protein CheW [Clostridia bacterium]